MAKKLRLSTVRLGSPRSRDEGLRIGAVRYLPRGVAKKDYARLDYFDVWLPNLAPSQALLSQLKKKRISSGRFLARYRREMNRPEPRQLIALLAAMARRMPLAVGCYCPDESQCHRSVLGRLIRAAGCKA